MSSNGKHFPRTYPAPIVTTRRAPTPEELVKRADAGKPLEPEEAKRFCFGVEPAFHRALKVAAAERGVSIRSLILDALHQYGIRE